MKTEAPWRKHSRCRNQGVDPDLFFVSDEEHRPKRKKVNILTPLEKIAVGVCAQCPVSGHCLKFALDNPREVGIWGGTTSDQRRELRRVRERSSCPRCVRGRIMALDATSQACMLCGLSWITE